MSNPAEHRTRQILRGLAIGLVAGLAGRWCMNAYPGSAAAWQWIATEVLDPTGQIFLRLLFFVVIPLVFASLALGVLQLGRINRLGPLAGRTFALFTLNMAIGVGIGLLLMNLASPGSRLGPEAQTSLSKQFAESAQKVQIQANTQPKITYAWLVETFMPRNLLLSIVGQSPNRLGDVLPLILFALLIGAAGTTLAMDRQASLKNAMETIAELMTRLVDWALILAPVAVAAMMASVALKLGWEFIRSLGLFVVIVLTGMLIHLFGTMSLLLRLFSRRSPMEFFQSIRTILITAFSTSSSNATLPTTIRITREQLGVSAPVAGFVLPLGATMNMSGTALYEGCVVLFIAQAYQVPLGIGGQITLLTMAVLSAVAVAGIPGASLPLIVGLLSSFRIPPEGIALILGVDRILDMARTTLNVAADVVTAVIVDEQMKNQTPDAP